MNNNLEEDILLAKKARKNSYSPYSNFSVGCVLVCKNGKKFTGSNIENNGIQSICAERVAFVKALSEGEKEFDYIVVAGAEKEKEVEDECLPCGYCRQFMNEFVDENFKIFSVSNSGIKVYTINDLLPYSFKL
jgi:cytidine deaminase